MRIEQYTSGGLVPLSRRHVQTVRKGAVTLADVAENQILTGMSILATQSAKGYAHTVVSPKVVVDAPTGQFFVHNAADANRDVVRKIAAGAPHPVSTVGGAYTSFTTEEYGIATFIPRQVSESANSMHRPEAAVKIITNWILINKERRLASDVFVTSAWTTSHVGATDFPQFGTESTGALNSSATPMGSILRLLDSISVMGQVPNTLFISSLVWPFMARSPDVLAMFQYVTGGLITAANLQDYLRAYTGDPDFRVIIGSSSYNAANEGATASMTRIHGDYIWAGYVDRNPAPYSAGALVTLVWTDFDQADFSDIPDIGVEQYYDQDRRIDIVRGNVHYTYMVTNANAGGMMTAILA